ncbi:MAG: trypsin-like peptidase domain-containing protein [Planctomycetota bacterium]
MITQLQRLLLGAMLVALGPIVAIAQSAPGEEKAAGEEKAEDTLEKAGEAFRNAWERIWVPRDRFTNGSYVRAAFEDVVTDAREATVRVRAGDRTVALGGVVGPDGWVLTKASRLKGGVTVLLADKREFDARVVGVDRDHDLAMLKIDAKGLASLKLNEANEASAGAWVATPGLSDDPVAIGVVSVAPRKIPHRAGVLGVHLDLSDPDVGGGLVVKVIAKTAAERAGLQVNDVITGVAGERTKSRTAVIRAIRRFSPLDELEVEVRRGDQTITFKATLTGRTKEMGPRTRSQYQNSLGSTLSQRRFGFPIALQHDSVLKPTECGGPLVDLDGRVIGFNIARAGRTESYAIPTRAVLPLMYKLMSGKQPPEDG